MSDVERVWDFGRAKSLPPGPWSDEPDKVQWIDGATGLDCLVLRNPIGVLCGYVGVPAGHPWYGKDYGALDVDVHGGLTFADACQPGDNEDRTCHVPFGDRSDDVWWLGFDCAHLWDLVPGMIDVLKDLTYPHPNDTYKNLGYVQAECAHLAEQIKAAT